MPSLQGADAPQWIDAEPKPMNDAPRAGTGPPRGATGREPARRACPTYWLALTLVVGGAGAIVPLSPASIMRCSPSLRAQRSNPDFGTAGLPRFARKDDSGYRHFALESFRFRLNRAPGTVPAWGLSPYCGTAE